MSKMNVQTLKLSWISPVCRPPSRKATPAPGLHALPVRIKGIGSPGSYLLPPTLTPLPRPHPPCSASSHQHTLKLFLALFCLFKKESTRKVGPWFATGLVHFTTLSLQNLCVSEKHSDSMHLFLFLVLRRYAVTQRSVTYLAKWDVLSNFALLKSFLHFLLSSCKVFLLLLFLFTITTSSE